MPSLLERLTKLETRVDELDKTLQRLNTYLNNINSNVNSLNNQIIRLKGKMSYIEKLQWGLYIPIILTLILTIIKLFIG